MELIHHHFSIIESTNTWGKQHAEELPRNKITLVTADEQTAGRGRFQRKWESSNQGNIYASFCFFIDPQRKDIGNISQLLTLSGANVLQSLEFSPVLKWPNDILLTNKKVAGVLTETILTSNQLCVITGIGLNVNMPVDILQKIDCPATSLAVERGQLIDMKDVLLRLQQQFSKDLTVFLLKGFSPFLDTYKHFILSNPNKTIRIQQGTTIWNGTIQDIHDNGSLCLKLANGELKTFLTGDVI